MAIVASYSTVSDEPISIKVGADLDKSFTFKTENKPDTKRDAVLSFNASFTGALLPTTLVVTLNGQIVVSKAFVGTGNLGGQEIIAKPPLQTDLTKDNTIEFALQPIPASGTVTFSDVVIWYKTSS
jgi:hypothetical protein